MEEILRLENVSVKYPDFTLLPVNMSLCSGESLAVLGESGSGKTTLARAISCLLPEGTKAEGTVIVCGKNLSAMKEKERKIFRMEEFAICFQNSMEWLNPSMTAYEQLSEVLIRKYPKKEHPGLALELMQQVGLEERDLIRYPKEMSGGMIQRFMLAMAIALKPKLLILDEPTSSLDRGARDEILVLIKKIRQETGVTILVITHDMVVAKELCERTMILYNGHVVEVADTKDLLHAAHHPYTFGLIQSFPELFPYRDMWGIRLPDEVDFQEKEHCMFYDRCTQRIGECACKRPELSEGPKGRYVACHRGGIIRVLSASGIKKSYGKQQVLVGADVKVYSGEVVAVAGKSGVGKTTLCSVLAGFLPPDEGTILFEGTDADYKRLHKEKGGVQMVFQDSADALNPNMTVLQAVSEPLMLSGEKDQDKIKEIVVRILKETGLPADVSFLKKRTEALSGGQKQRINLARALTMEPKLLIADEPTSMLDASSKANVLRMLKGLQNRKGCAMLIITHDLDSARKIADRVYLVEDGITKRIKNDELMNVIH